jgi:two-component system, response regulator
MKNERLIHVLIAEDDDDDRLLIIKAFEKCLPVENVNCVTDGEALLDYLYKTSSNENTLFPTPDIILLDLNMPKKDGKTTLQEIKGHEVHRKIPVIIFTTSCLKEDIHYTYKMGSNSFITKPGSFEDLVQITKELVNYWSTTVELPS